MEAIIAERPGLQRLRVALDNNQLTSAYSLTDLTGRADIGDQVVLNTTAVELGLGTGGWHVVHWNLARSALHRPGPGHIMKMRYTSLQADVGCVEELQGAILAEADEIDQMPVVVCGLHSQVPCVAVAVRNAWPEARIAYVMTDAAALPLALSDLVAAMVDRDLVNTTITSGQAFGGDHEAVNVASALVAARHVENADVAIVSMGPGVVGTGTRLGYSGLEVGCIIHTVAWLGGRPIAALRFSQADGRLRHQGISHHSLTALSMATHARATIGLPRGPYEQAVLSDLNRAGLSDLHQVIVVDTPDIAELLVNHDLHVTSMGRGPRQDPGFFAVSGAAGTCAAGMA